MFFLRIDTAQGVTLINPAMISRITPGPAGGALLFLSDGSNVHFEMEATVLADKIIFEINRTLQEMRAHHTIPFIPIPPNGVN